MLTPTRRQLRYLAGLAFSTEEARRAASAASPSERERELVAETNRRREQGARDAAAT